MSKPKITVKPRLSVAHAGTNEPLLLEIPTFLSKLARTSDVTLSKKSIRALQNLRLLQDMYADQRVMPAAAGDDKGPSSSMALARDVQQEFMQLNQLWRKVCGEIESLEVVFQTMVEQHHDLRSQLTSYEAYLTNVRIQAAGGVRRLAGGSKTPLFMVGGGTGTPGAGFISVNDNNINSRRPLSANADASDSATPPATTHAGQRRPSFRAKKSGDSHVKSNAGKPLPQTLVKYTHVQLEKDGVIVESAVPANRRAHIYFSMRSPIPGSFLVGMHYKGRDQPIYELEITLDDLLEKQQDNVRVLNLEYVQLNVNKVLHVLNRHFLKQRA